MNKIEQVAKAIFDQYEWGLTNGMKDLMHSTAKRAIEAMKEPTEEMCRSIGNNAFQIEDYEVMIDAALKE